MGRANKRFLVISLILGIALFLMFIVKLGKSAIQLITSNFNLPYLGIYAVLSILAFLPLAWRWQVILKAHGKKINIWKLLKQTIAGYAVSYITPAARIGGEPLRAYMLKKECRVDLKTGSSSIIIDKFVELLGSVLYGVLGLGLLMFVPEAPRIIKLVLGGIVVLVFLLLSFLYYRLVKRKGFFSYIFVLLHLSKFSKSNKILEALIETEEKIGHFFREHKKTFLIAFFFYCVSGAIFIIEFKFLFLGIGINISIAELILIITFLGVINFVPVPAALGVLEAGQSGLFYLLKGEGSIGLAFSLLVRIRNFSFVALGFLIISSFSGKEIIKEFNKEQNLS
jgi:glycosyltransferase 2 family protein